MTVTTEIEKAMYALVAQAQKTRKTLQQQESRALPSYDVLMGNVSELLRQIKLSLEEEVVSLRKTERNIQEHIEIAQYQARSIDKKLQELRL